MWLHETIEVQLIDPTQLASVQNVPTCDATCNLFGLTSEGLVQMVETCSTCHGSFSAVAFAARARVARMLRPPTARGMAARVSKLSSKGYTVLPFVECTHARDTWLKSASPIVDVSTVGEAALGNAAGRAGMQEELEVFGAEEMLRASMVPGCERKEKRSAISQTQAQGHPQRPRQRRARAFKCPHCEKDYVFSGGLAKHVRKKHSGD